MNEQQLTDIWNGMVAVYGDELPDPDHCPRQFKHYLKLFMRFHYMK